MIKHVHACMYTSKKASRKSVFPVYNFFLVAKGRKRVLLRPEKVEKGSFTLKMDQIFSVHTKKRNLKTQQSSVTFDFFLFEKRKKKLKLSLDQNPQNLRACIVLKKLLFQTIFCPNRNEISAFSNSSGFENGSVNMTD